MPPLQQTIEQSLQVLGNALLTLDTRSFERSDFRRRCRAIRNGAPHAGATHHIACGRRFVGEKIDLAFAADRFDRIADLLDHPMRTVARERYEHGALLLAEGRM